MDNMNHQNYEYNPSGAGYYDNSGYDNSGYYGGDGQQIPGQYYPTDGAYGAEGAYGGETVDPNALSYYPPQSQYDYSRGDGWMPSHGPESSTRDGSFYFNSEFTPQIFGFPVNALAYDSAYEAIYVASPTQSMSSTRWRSHRASMLAIHNTVDGMCYASVGGHGEAQSQILQQVYESMYGIKKTVQMARQHIPPHAYRPPYGGSQVEASMALGGGKNGHLGINSILPLSNGYAATISPSAVRIHSHGGLQVNDHGIEGMLCGTIHPHSEKGTATHISVGGLAVGEKKYTHHDIFCMDIWQGLRVVNSWAFNKKYSGKTGVSAMATSHERGSIIAGCTDGNIRLLDGSLREIASVKSHAGGVSDVSISPDGMLIATVGYSSRLAPGKETGILYGFPDPSVYIYDIRYLGRGGIPHVFSGARGCPCHVSFIPDIEGLSSNRVLVASGQPGGGLQIVVPFQEANDSTVDFFTPQMAQGEFISAMTSSEDDLALGTSNGHVLQYKLKGCNSKSSTLSASSASFIPSAQKSTATRSSGLRAGDSKTKQPLEMSELYMQRMPAFSIDPSLLLHNGDPGTRNGPDDRMKALFSTYVLQTSPKISSIGHSKEDAIMSFGGIGGKPLVTSAKRTVAQSLIKEAAIGERDFLLTIPTSKLDLDILGNFATTKKEKKLSPKANPNKLLYVPKLQSIGYEAGVNEKRMARQRGQKSAQDDLPARYRRQMRPTFKTARAFDPTDRNNTGLFPGWDYSSTMPNAFATPVLLLLYFVPEIRSSILAAQYNEKLFSSKAYEKALSPELGFVFHQIETLYGNALLHPTKVNSNPLRSRIGVWTPSNFLTALGTMPEAEQLQILDGSPAAVDPPRRSEAFYRFLAYQLDKEISKNTEKKLMDSMHGLDFMSVNQFLSETSLSSQSTTRALTLDLTYDAFSREADKKNPVSSIRFGSLLQHSLCRETRLRAWNKKSKAYETIVQRKIATSLPEILTLSCACAGRKEEDGLWIWRTDDGAGPWLPEIVEVELLKDGQVSVKEMKFNDDEDVEEVWASKKRSKLPKSLSEIMNQSSSRQKHRYRLDAVVSYINDTEDDEDSEHSGYHVLHARVPVEYKRRVLRTQQEKANKRAIQEVDPSKLVLSSSVSPETFQKRAESAEKRLKSIKESDNDWVLYNGFAVTKTVAEDARAFHVPFKEPCLVVYREMNDTKTGTEEEDHSPVCKIPAQVMNARSLSSATSKNSKSFDYSTIGEGKLVAFDAEFVSVQEEEAILTDSGAKVVLRETRHAIGRISVIDCEARGIIFDDHVLPREQVVDYLTRFSGIVAEDLDTSKSPHNLISTRSAYLKLRYLMERGCIFLGHGLKLDFANVNLTVPPHQVVDTVEIFHQPGMRYISLRFLANYVLKRDMQQDIHDSVEDALTAFELYEKALEWKSQGIFDKKLQEIYSYGTQTDWKLGVEKLSK